MINPKNICISAAVGFVLSFFIGLISGVNILHLLIRAAIFAAVFAALSAGITYVYKSFLSDGSASDSDSVVSSESKPAAGSVVNIVVDDSTLKDDGSSPKFSVTNSSVLDGESLVENGKKSSDEKSGFSKAQASAQMKDNAGAEKAESFEPAIQSKNGKSDSNSVSETKSNGNSAGGFVPAGLNAITGGGKKVSDSNAVQPNISEEKKEAESALQNEADTSDEESIDNLPDIGGVDFDGSSASSGSVITDSDFATGGSPVPSAAAGNVGSAGSAGSQDAATMAKAIATLLAKDNE